MSAMPFSSRFAADFTSNSPASSFTSAFASSGLYAARKNWLIVPRLIGSGYTTPLWFV